jgi:teichuronic acid exporter
MKEKTTKTHVISNLIWKLLERGAVQGVQLVIQIILARLLLPSDYGIIAIVTIFIYIAGVFVQTGFHSALIQKKEIDSTDLSSVFYLSLLIASMLYIILFFTAPLIAVYYNELQLTSIIRILSITLFFGAVSSIQNSIIARKMQFKKLFISSLIAVIISGTIGVVMAYMGYGIWALVAQQLINQILVTGILYFTVKWRPQLLFSLDRIKKLFSFGSKLLIATLIDTVYNEIRGLIIGKMYNTQTLGYYNRGRQFPHMIVLNTNGAIQSVMFPVLSAEQNDKQRVKEIVRRSIAASTLIIFPLMMGLAAVAEPLVIILLTEKWLPSVPFIQIFCASYALWPIHTANLQAINALGRSDIFLKLELVKKIVGTIVLVITMFFGVFAMAFGVLIVGILCTFINAYPNLKLLGYSYKEQGKDIMPPLLISLLMGAVVYSVSFIGLSSLITLIIQIVVGVGLYIILTKLFNTKSFNYLVNAMKEMYNSKKN